MRTKVDKGGRYRSQLTKQTNCLSERVAHPDTIVHVQERVEHWAAIVEERQELGGARDGAPAASAGAAVRVERRDLAGQHREVAPGVGGQVADALGGDVGEEPEQEGGGAEGSHLFGRDRARPGGKP